MSPRLSSVAAPTRVSNSSAESMLESSSRCEAVGRLNFNRHFDPRDSAEKAGSFTTWGTETAEARDDVIGAVVGLMGLAATIGLMAWLAFDQLYRGVSTIQIAEMVRFFE